MTLTNLTILPCTTRNGSETLRSWKRRLVLALFLSLLLTPLGTPASTGDALMKRENEIANSLKALSDTLILNTLQGNSQKAAQILSEMLQTQKRYHLTNLPGLSLKLIQTSASDGQARKFLRSAALQLSPTSPDVSFLVLKTDVLTHPFAFGTHVSNALAMLDDFLHNTEAFFVFYHYFLLALTVMLLLLAIASLAIIVIPNWPALWLHFRTHPRLQTLPHLRSAITITVIMAALLFFRLCEIAVLLLVLSLIVTPKKNIRLCTVVLLLLALLPVLFTQFENSYQMIETPSLDVTQINRSDRDIFQNHDLFLLTPDEKDPAYFPVRFSQALMLQDLGLHAQAKTLYETLLVKYPATSAIYNNLGNIAIVSGETDLALQHYHKAIQIDTNNLYAHYNLSKLHTALLDLSEAKKHLALAEQIDARTLRSIKRGEAETHQTPSTSEPSVRVAMPVATRLPDDDLRFTSETPAPASLLSESFLSEYWPRYFSISSSLVFYAYFLIAIFIAVVIRHKRQQKPVYPCEGCGQLVQLVQKQDTHILCNACINIATNKSTLDVTLREKKHNERFRYKMIRSILSFIAGLTYPGSNLILASRPFMGLFIMLLLSFGVSILYAATTTLSLALSPAVLSNSLLFRLAPLAIWLPLALLSIIIAKREIHHVS